eukprot:9087980-Pyramimonas_sp.AAC.1
MTTLVVARAIATLTLLGLSMKPQSCQLLDRVVRYITRSASPAWLESMVEMVSLPLVRCSSAT